MDREVTVSSHDKVHKVGIVRDNALICPRKSDHLFRGGASSNAVAIKQGTAGWGLDSSVCNQMLEEGVEWFIVESGIGQYRCRMEDLKLLGTLKNFGYGAQYILNLKHFEKVRR